MESALREVWRVGSAVRRESRLRRHVRQIMVADWARLVAGRVERG